jgi:hypothetical protein
LPGLTVKGEKGLPGMAGKHGREGAPGLQGEKGDRVSKFFNSILNVGPKPIFAVSILLGYEPDKMCNKLLVLV